MFQLACFRSYRFHSLDLLSCSHLLRPGNVLTRRGPLLSNGLVSKTIGILHWGVVSRVEPWSPARLENYAHLVTSFSETRNPVFRVRMLQHWLETVQVAHYARRSREHPFRIQETSLGVFLCGFRSWESSEWTRHPELWSMCYRLDTSVNLSVEQEQGIISRVSHSLGMERYNLLVHNCEHWANWVRNGSVDSVQARTVGNVGWSTAGVFTVSALWKCFKCL